MKRRAIGSMANPFHISITESAEDDLKWFSAYVQRTIVDGIEIHLRQEPMLGTRRIVSMRPNAVAGWELRLGDYRVLYDVDDTTHTVTVEAIGEKRGNKLLIRGQEFTEHESH
jgi:mRNA-degrading endonuclease RelE of RelBE toxin-antitoxin system